MDDLARSYYQMYNCDVIVEEFAPAEKVRYHIIPEGVDVEAIKRNIQNKGKEAADPNKSRREVEELHNNRRKEVKQLVKEGKAPKPTRLPLSRERNIGKHDDWKDPHPDTSDWGEESPAKKKLISRMKFVLGTQRRQDIELGLRREEFDFIISYLLENGFASDEQSAENIMEAMSENWIESILSEAPFDIYRGNTSIEGTKVGSPEPIKVNKTSYKNRKRANTRADKLNQEYGANIYRVVRTPEN